MGKCTVAWLVLSVMCTLVPPCSGESAQELPKSPVLLQGLRSMLTELSEKAHGYLVFIFGKRAVETSLENTQGAVKTLAEGAASVLNVVAAYITESLGAMGIGVQLPFHRITPEGMVTVAQWALLVAIGYWLLSLALRLVTGAVRRALWLLKLAVAVGLFGLILSDSGAGAETTAMRLAGLVCGCVLLGVGPAFAKGDKAEHVEEQVRVLERRLREMERRRKEE